MKLVVLLLVFITCYFAQATPRGVQIRLTTKGMNYAASIGVRVIQKELTNRRIDRQSGNIHGITWSAGNLIIRYVRVGNYRVTPLANNGIRIAVGGIKMSASGQVSARFRLGWITTGASNNVNVNSQNIGFNLVFRFDARSGKPYLTATSCSATTDIKLSFGGSIFSWVYNAISGLFTGMIRNVMKNMMCKIVRSTINKGANDFFKNFPVQLPIANLAIINYAFKKPVITSTYLDLLLRGEFLNPRNPVPSFLLPPSFDTITSSNKMGYVWLSDFTLNSAGKVFHETGILKALFGPLTKQVPAEIKPFLNTKSFEKRIPELYRDYPDQPIEFQVLTNKPPTFEIQQGNGAVKIYVRTTVVVEKEDGSKLNLFYLDMDVHAVGKVFVKPVSNQLMVGGNIDDFTFGVKIGGSILGDDIKIPLEDIKNLVNGLVVSMANKMLNIGLPLPKIKGLEFINPEVSYVKNAVRVDTDIAWRG